MPVFADRNLILPAHTGIHRENVIDLPVIVDECAIEGLTKVLIGIAERKRARFGNAKNEIRHIRSRSRARECEGPARVLLRKRVQLLAAHISAKCEVVLAAIPKAAVRNSARLTAIE